MEKVVIPFQSQTAIAIAGPSQIGKSTWALKLLRQRDVMFHPKPPSAVLYCYTCDQPSLEKAEIEIPDFHLHKGLPTPEVIESLGPHPIIVLDDMMQEVVSSQECASLFTREVHHKGYTVLYIVQNLYEQGKCARTIALNCNYVILFKHVRDKSQLITLGRQVYPGKSGKIAEALDDVTREDPRGYLVLDHTCTGDDRTRLRTKIFSGEEPVIYL